MNREMYQRGAFGVNMVRPGDLCVRLPRRVVGDA